MVWRRVPLIAFASARLPEPKPWLLDSFLVGRLRAARQHALKPTEGERPARA